MLKLGKITGLVSIVLIAGCASADANKEFEGAMYPKTEMKSKTKMYPLAYLSAAQIQKLFVGYTYPLNRGEIYFSSPTRATLIWSGVIENTNWYATDNSSFCYMKGSEENCISINRANGGNYVQDDNGSKKIITAAQIKKGKVFYNYYR